MYDEQTQINDDNNITVKEFYKQIKDTMRVSLFNRLKLMEMTQEQRGSVYQSGVCPHLPDGYVWKDGIVQQEQTNDE